METKIMLLHGALAVFHFILWTGGAMYLRRNIPSEMSPQGCLTGLLIFAVLPCIAIGNQLKGDHQTTMLWTLLMSGVLGFLFGLMLSRPTPKLDALERDRRQ